MKNRLTDAIRTSTADYTEIRFENQTDTTIIMRKEDVEKADYTSFEGGTVRACIRGGWGVSSFDSPDNLKQHVEKACAFAGLAAKEKTELAETDTADEQIEAEPERDFRGVSLEEKLKLVQHYNTLLLKRHRDITTTMVMYGDSMRKVYFANSSGCYFSEERPRVMCRFSATAKKGNLVQSAGDGVSSVNSYDAVLGLEEKAAEAADRAVALLTAPKCPGGPHTVILDPRLGGVFAHEAFGHLSEADFLYENEKMREIMVIGKKFGADNLDIIDDGSMKGRGGSLTYDDEGTPAGRTYLIKGGMLAGYLHNRETAAIMGGSPTGNARAVRRDVPPIVRMTNTYIGNGAEEVSDLFKGVEKGIYACEMFGGTTTMEMFTFSAAYGYLIEQGEIGPLIRDVMLTGNIFETLLNIDGIANDLKVEDPGGGCGKGGQYPLPVGLGSPHVRVRNVITGGNTIGSG